MKENNHHYFLPSKHDKSEYFTFDYEFKNKKYIFNSCPDVFSKDEVDYGSQVLIQSILAHQSLFGGDIIDMCCGYGTIAIILSSFIGARYYLSDINSTATDLAKDNVRLNNIQIEEIFTTDMFDGIDKKFNHIVSNPPIKVGKQVLLKFIDESYTHLLDGGTITLVIKKNLGAPSLKEYMEKIFGNCEIWKRDKGYYILHSVLR